MVCGRSAYVPANKTVPFGFLFRSMTVRWVVESLLAEPVDNATIYFSIKSS